MTKSSVPSKFKMGKPVGKLNQDALVMLPGFAFLLKSATAVPAPSDKCHAPKRSGNEVRQYFIQYWKPLRWNCLPEDV